MAGLHIQANIKWLQHLGGDLSIEIQNLTE